MTEPTPAQLAFHEDLKAVLVEHEQRIGTVALTAILSQVAGSTIAISMVYDHMPATKAVEVIIENAKRGMESCLSTIARAGRTIQ